MCLLKLGPSVTTTTAVSKELVPFSFTTNTTASNFHFLDYFLFLIGNIWTASAHIITAVIGSGVLSLAWATAQLGWVAGPTVLFLFSFVTYYTSSLLATCYRTGDPVTGKRNYTYMDAVRSNLGEFSWYGDDGLHVFDGISK